MQCAIGLKNVSVAFVSFLLVGCGEPNYGAMKPTLAKPAVEVLLVNHPASWSSADVQTMATEEHVEVNVKYVSESNLGRVLTTDVQKLTQVSLFVIVGDGDFEQTLSQVAMEHLQSRFDWFHGGPPATPIQSPNLRSVRLDENLVSYATAWLAAEVAQSQGSYVVGWVNDGVSELTKSNTMAAFGGLFTEDNLIQVFPVTFTTSNQLPKFMIANRALTASEWSMVAQSGSIVFSPVAQPLASSKIATVPALPGMSYLTQDIANVLENRLNYGDIQVSTEPLLNIQVGLLPTSTSDVLQAITSSIVSDNTIVQDAWSRLPLATQQLWSPYVMQAQS